MITPRQTLYALIAHAKVQLDVARSTGDELRVDLAEATLNSLLDRLTKEREL